MLKTGNSRRNEVMFLMNAGMNYAQIGRQLGLSRERVRQIAKGEGGRKKRPDTENPEALLTTAQVAELLNVHVNTVRRWNTRGLIQTYRIGPRGDRRFRRADVINILVREKS